MLSIRKTALGYDAEAGSPHTRREWRTKQPTTAADLVAVLRKLGCHPTDIGDAFFEADPNWLESPSLRRWWIVRRLVNSGPY